MLNHLGVCRTAPATPGMLIIPKKIMVNILKVKFYIAEDSMYIEAKNVNKKWLEKFCSVTDYFH